MENDRHTGPSSSGADPGSRIHRGGDALLSSLPYVPLPAADWRLWGEVRADDLTEQMATMNIGGRRGYSSLIGDRGPEQRLTRASSAPGPFTPSQWPSSTLGNPHRGDLSDLFPLGNAGPSFGRRGPPFDFPWTQQSAYQSRDFGFLNPPNAAAAASFALNPHSVSLGDNPLCRLGRGRQIDASHGLHLCSQEIPLGSILPLKPDSAAARRCIYCTAKDQEGCQTLLWMITAGDSHPVDIIFVGIINHVTELMRDPVAHHLVQALLDVCTEEHRLNFLFMLSQDRRQLFRVSVHPHGTRVVQKLIETVTTIQQVRLVITAFKSIFLELARDSTGNRVIRSLLTYLPHPYNKFIFDAAATHCVLMAKHQHGCCLLQRCLEHSSCEEQHKVKITMQIANHAFSLALDPFGNYAIQYVLKIRIPIVNSRLASQFSGYYITLSTQKFSSNVVEKCLEYFEEEGRAGIVSELLSVPRFEELLQDQYANYVIKAALKHTQGYLRAGLEAAILPHSALRNHPHCKRIFSIVLRKR